MRQPVATIASFLVATAMTVAAFAFAAPAGASGGNAAYGSLASGVTLSQSVPRPAHFPPGVWKPARALPDTAICANDRSTNCIVSQGSGNVARIKYNQSTNWVFNTAGACGYCYTIHVNSTGNCMYADSDHYVYTGSNPCYDSAATEVWEAFVDSNGVRYSFYNTGRSNWMGVFFLTDGSRVQVWPVQTGYYTGWKLQCCPG